MADDVPAALLGEAAPEDWQPTLDMWNAATEQWESAKATCPPELQYDHVDYKARLYSVDICHLTQVTCCAA